jgi:cytoskeletal protein CcmA (bactofilin family)
MDNLLLYTAMFGTKKPNNEPRPLNDSGRSLISETFSLEGTLRTSGAIDVAGLIKGGVYTNDLVIKETGSIIGPIETDRIEIYGHLEGKVVAKTIIIGNTAVVKGDILFSETLKTEAGADITGYIKKTESTSLEAAQDEFRLDSIETGSQKEQSKKSDRPKIVASN